MELIKITIENFKGINKVELDLSKSPHNNIYTLVGINESGKTTILEAINHFEYNDEKDLNTKAIEFADMIPIKLKTNFNSEIKIIASIKCDASDNKFLRKYLQDNYEYKLASDICTIEIIQSYTYENSVYKDKKFTWHTGLKAIKKGGSKPYDLYRLDNECWQNIVNSLKDRMPKILYFPTAFFDLPDRICLSEIIDAKDEFLLSIIQDILDSLDNNLNIKEHIVDRVVADDRKLISQISLEMSRKINEVILDEWKKVLNNTEYTIDIELYKDTKDANTYLEFNVQGKDGVFKLSERSLGFRWFFMFLLLTKFRGFRKNENRHIVFLFDEPAANLSSKAQKQLLDSLQRISDQCTIIYTTHSHHLVNPAWLEGAHVVSNDALENGDLEAYNSKNTNIKLEKYRTYVNSNPQNTSYFQPILDVLEYIPNELDMTLPTVILEGKNDYYTLKYFFDVQLNDNICLIPGMSCNNAETLISLYHSWGKNFVVLLDSDEAAETSRKRYDELFGRIVENKIFTLKDINAKWTKSLEGIIDSKERFKIQKHLFPNSKKYSKKMFNKAIQELLMTGNKIHVDKIIIDDFNSILSFCQNKLTGGV